MFESLRMLDQDITDDQLRWEYLKYEIQEIYNEFSKHLLKEANIGRNFLQKELKKLEKNLTNFQTNQFYFKYKQKLCK